MEDELLSSWLVRTALAHGCAPLALSGIVWPKWRAFGNDLDRGMRTERAASLGRLAGCTVAQVESCSLHSLVETLTDKPTAPVGTWPWILARGSRNLRCAAGLQLCPSCFAEAVPYYSIRSRLAWHTVCARHQTWLIDHCPNCWAALQPHCLLPPHQDCCACHRCGYLLSTTLVEKAPDSFLAFQQAADECLAGRQVTQCQSMATHDWFCWARSIVSFVRFASLHPSRSLIAVLDELGIGTIGVNCSGLAFEALPVRDRAVLLRQAWKIMSLDPMILVKVFRAHELPRSAIQLPRGSSVPSSLSIIVQALRDGPKKHRSRRVSGGARPNAAKAWARLLRKFSRDG
ncbi:hypothetical protein BVK86_11135 [Pseudomonas reinekei]|nr:hypothetical protein BVK86_11135 [Pseudomonas reinekei]